MNFIDSGEDEREAENKVESIRPPKLLGSVRLVIVILMFFAIFHVIWLRFNFSIGIVCMTGTDNNETDPGYTEGEFNDWSRETIALMLSSFFYGYMCTQVAGGYLADQFGEKWTLLIGMFFMGVSELQGVSQLLVFLKCFFRPLILRPQRSPICHFKAETRRFEQPKELFKIRNNSLQNLHREIAKLGSNSKNLFVLFFSFIHFFFSFFSFVFFR